MVRKSRDYTVKTASSKFIKGREYLLELAIKKLNSLNWRTFDGDFKSFCRMQQEIQREIDNIKSDIKFANNMVSIDELAYQKTKQRYGLDN